MASQPKNSAEYAHQVCTIGATSIENKGFSTALILRHRSTIGIGHVRADCDPLIQQERILYIMWKPTNQPQTPARPAEPERPTSSMPSTPAMTSSPAAEPAPRPVATTTADQATIGKSLVIKGEVTGSESLYIDGRVEGSINLAGNRVTVGRNGVVAANINAREIVVLGKVRGNLTASDRVDIRSDGSLTGDVIAARISIEDGAFFKGGIDIRKGGQPQQKPNGEDKSVPVAETAAVGARA
jgi:cytoskeletal protein CcmA (bactofilin family)